MSSPRLPLRRASGRVPLARRLQHGDRRRAVLSVLGAAGGVLLVLATSALLAGFHRQETAYLDRSPAALVVSQRGVGTMQLSISALPVDTAARAARVEGVEWVEPIRHLTTTITAPGRDQLVSYVFGYDPASGRGGPQRIHAGRPPGAGEVLLDRGGAAQLGLGIGDELDVFGRRLRVAGLTEGLTSLANTTVFLTSTQFADLAGPGTSYVLIGAAPDEDLAELSRRVAAALPDVQVQTRAQFVAQEAALVRDMYTGVIRAVQLVGLVVAYALIALALSMATASNRASFGVLRALGAPGWQVGRTVLAQSLWVVGAATALATAAVAALARLVPLAASNVALVLTPRDVLLTALLTLLVGCGAALAPLRSVLRADPAGAFRQGT